MKKMIWIVVILIIGFVAYKMMKPKDLDNSGNDNPVTPDDGVLDNGGAQARY